ncbi:MAG: DUF5667 domain-containing protein [Patescibacteria group bacterium]
MKYIVSILLFAIVIFTPARVHAEYVLPYPSFMPGNKIYRVSRMFDQLKRYWSFGSIAQTKYTMNMADKYLVEAKTLFEYKQYLLAFDALDRSDKEIVKLSKQVQSGIEEKKNMSLVVESIKEEMSVHEMLLTKLQKEMPSEFIWTPEKQASTVLSIRERLMISIKLRQDIRVSMNE